MKVIDLLNKIANGEEVPKKIRIDHWCYIFEWKDYAGNYVDEHENIDLMSALSCDKEELNYEVHEIKEDKKIEKIKVKDMKIQASSTGNYCYSISQPMKILINKINEIIDYLKENK